MPVGGVHARERATEVRPDVADQRRAELRIKFRVAIGTDHAGRHLWAQRLKHVRDQRPVVQQHQTLVSLLHAQAATAGENDAVEFARPNVVVTTQSTSSASAHRSEEHTSELQSLMRSSYAVFCLK